MSIRARCQHSAAHDLRRVFEARLTHDDRFRPLFKARATVGFVAIALQLVELLAGRQLRGRAVDLNRAMVHALQRWAGSCWSVCASCCCQA